MDRGAETDSGIQAWLCIYKTSWELHSLKNLVLLSRPNPWISGNVMYHTKHCDNGYGLWYINFLKRLRDKTNQLSVHFCLYGGMCIEVGWLRVFWILLQWMEQIRLFRSRNKYSRYLDGAICRRCRHRIFEGWSITRTYFQSLESFSIIETC